MDELIEGNTLSSLCYVRLRWHRLADNRAAILNNGTCGQVPTFAASSALPPVRRTAR